MKQAYSLNTVAESGRIDVESLVSVPPGCEKLKIVGVLQLNLKIQYITKTNANLLFKTKLWGREEEDLTFRRINEKQAVLNLAVRSSLENASKYFSDMGVICIECYISGKEDLKEPLRAREFTHFGRIYISIKRYVVSFLLCDFQETFPIVDQRKNKVGEVTGMLSIEQGRKDSLYPAATQPEIRHDRFQSANTSVRPSHDYSPSNPVKAPERKESFQHTQFAQRRQPPRNSMDELQGKRNTMVEHPSRADSNQELPWKTERRKGKATLFLQEYNRSKPEHTELSVIQSKYGYNCPSIEAMKLKLDEAVLLSNHQQPAFKDGARINLLLKSIKNHSKGLIDSLSIYYQQSQQSLKTETKILLNEQVNGKIEVNYLYVLQEVAGEDSLVFQVKEAKIEVNIVDLKDKKAIELKGRNGKKMATLYFAFIEEQFVPALTNIHVKQDKQPSEKKQDVHLQKSKQNCFLKVEGWGKGQAILRNKKIGVVNGPKIMYELQSQDQSSLQIQLFSGKDHHFIKIDINHLLKQQNFVFEGRQVKIITARGEISDLLNLVSKIDSSSNRSERTERSEEQGGIDIKDIAYIFECLEKCENEECNEIMQSLSKQFNLRRLQKLSQLIGVNAQTFQKIIGQVFSSSFDKFSQTFLAYHNWNHRYLSNQRKVERIIQGNLYNSDVQKTVKRLKRSSEAVFGIVSSAAFMNEFMRGGQMLLTEQTESQFSREELGKLIVLLLERYPARCIKLSQLQCFVGQTHNCLHLNAYLLSKVAREIMNDQESFEDVLSTSEWTLLDVLRSECDGEWGLAKLLLTNEEEMAESSTISNSQTERKATDPAHQGEQPAHAKTELSKEEGKKAQPEESFHHLPTQNQHKDNITIILSSLTIPNIDAVQEIEIFSQYQGLKLQREQIIFPKAIQLIKDSTNTVIVSTLHDIFEGVFIANVRAQNVKLFNNGSEAGLLKIFSQQSKQKSNFEDEEVTVRIKDAQMKPVPYREELSKQEEEEAEIRCITPIAKSSYVKVTIRSIRPTRSNYKLIISSPSQRKTLNFPNQNQIILKNSNQGWQMVMIDQQVDYITVTNHLASSPYCFVERRDQRVVFTAVIEVEECWDPQLSLGLKQSLHLIIHFDELLSVREVEEGQYALISECQPKLSPAKFHNHASGTKISIYQSIIAESPPERVNVKLVNTTSKEEIAQFRLALRVIEGGVSRSTRYLLSSVKGYRLRITIFQIRHSWDYCRPDRVVALFNSENRRTIESWIRSVSEPTEEKLIAWLKGNFNLALSQITILLEELLHRESQNPVEAFFDAFKRCKRFVMDALAEIKDEFAVFDYNDEGTVTEEQLRIAKKVFSRSFKSFYTFLLDNQNSFIPSPEVSNNFIIDLSPAIKSNSFDYLSFLDLMESQHENSPFDKKKKDIVEIQKKDPERGEYLSIRIVQFENLSLNKLPCTFLFKVNDQILAQPIHKCYTFKYPISNEIIVSSKPPPQLHIFLQSLKANGTWEYKMLETLPLSENIRVFGGSIKFLLQSTDKSRPQANNLNKKQVYSNENHDSNGNRHHSRSNYPSPKKEKEADRSFSQSMNKQFSKSFWNKSLNETKQKWSQWKQSKKGQKQVKMPLKFDEKMKESEEQY